jgi:pimeloyl-ACP methyl ester carboxylesterase
MLRRTAIALLSVALVVGATACGSDAEPAATLTGSVAWEPCAGGVQCATLAVPLDRAKPDGETIELALARRPAGGNSKGVLLTNPGGPGGSGVEFLRNADAFFSDELLDTFDIVAWDPRGVGDSAPVRCLENLDDYYAADRSPDSAQEEKQTTAATQAFVDACEKNSGNLLPHVSTEDTVADMDAIRAAYGAEQVNYIGFSYGTYLGALYAEKYPERVRAMVLDGALDPTLSFTDLTIQQAEGFDNALDEFFEFCRTEGCGFSPSADPAQTFDKLATSVDAEPVFANLNGENRTLGPGEFDIGVASGLYSGRAGWKELGAALAQTATGLGNDLLALSDAYTQRLPGGKYSNSTAAFNAVGCLDAIDLPKPGELDGLATEAAKVAPRFGAATAWLSQACTLWPVKPKGVPAIDAKGAPPIVVVGTTNDPATPYVWAESLAEQLDSGHLLTIEGAAHTGYGRGNDCVDNAIDDYLVNLTVPAAGTRC